MGNGDKNNRRIKYWLTKGVTAVSVVIVGLFVISLFTPQEQGYSEITEYMILDSQYFCDYCDGCYCFNGTFKNCFPPNCGFCYGILKKSEGDYRSLFFADEFVLHPEWKSGDVLQVTWKPTVYGWRVRRVVKYE